MKTPFETAQTIAQECISKAPVIILGSGASIACGIPGMPELRDHLLTMPLPAGLSRLDAASWAIFVETLKATDLESALTKIPISDCLTRCVVETTWDFLAPFDLRVFSEVIQKRSTLGLTRLFQHMFNSTHPEINVITPNYDRLAEYAADAGDMCHFTGFGYGHLRFRARDPIPRIHYGKNHARTVNIWKVHGSLDWFRDSDGLEVGLPLRESRPGNLEPVIVTPGVEKYRRTHDEPFRSIIQGADRALQSARSFLCVGYGFNDSHLQTLLIERCRKEPVPLVLITKQITPAAKEFLLSGKCQRYLALEECEIGCRICSSEYPGGVEVEGPPFWQFDGFLSMVT